MIHHVHLDGQYVRIANIYNRHESSRMIGHKEAYQLIGVSVFVHTNGKIRHRKKETPL